MSQILFKNCQILDADAGSLSEGHVLVEGREILEVSEEPISSKNARVIDVHGKTLMPGLIDAHIHATVTTLKLSAVPNRPTTLVAQEARGILEAMLLRGFTTVRDAGGADWGLAESVRRGLITGPEMLISGRVLSQTGGHGDFRPRVDSNLCACSIYTTSFAQIADGVPAVRKAAREELRRGATQLKIMASGGVASPTDPIWNVQYSESEIRAIVEEAEGWRTYVMAHAYTPEAIQRVVNCGVRTVEHGNLIDAETAKLVADKNAFVVPTLVTYSMMSKYGAQFSLPTSSQAKVKDVLDSGLRSIELCTEAGVKLGFGTDLLGETHKHQNLEFEIRAEAQKPAEIIRSATVTNAEIIQRDGETGVIAPGAQADLIIVDGNPLENIGLLGDEGRHLAAIMKNGAFVTNQL